MIEVAPNSAAGARRWSPAAPFSHPQKRATTMDSTGKVEKKPSVVSTNEVDNEGVVMVENGPPVIYILEVEEEGVEVEKSGDFANPILVDSLLPFRDGSHNRPISFEDDDDDDVEFIEERSADRRKQGSNKKNPISVDDYVVNLDYLKGKRPLREWVEVLEIEVIEAIDVIKEVGESSSRPPAEPEEYCNICMDPKFRHECFDIKGCSHYYCASCIAQYVEAKVEDNVTSIGCPDPNCKDGFLELEMCQLILKPEVFDRWGTALCESMIGAMKFYCPFKDCSALLIDEGGGEGGYPIIQAECPHCCRLFCAQCKVPWHVVSCKEYQKLGLDERGREDIMLREMAKSCQWQRCPKCKYYVEKIDGCMFMKCRCGHQFCYGCATTMTIDHYCRKCKR